MKKRLMMALAGAALVAAMLPGVASAAWVTPDNARAHVWKGPLPDPIIIQCQNVPDPVFDPKTGIEYFNECDALRNGVRVVLDAN